MDFDDVVDEVMRRLDRERMGTIVSVWADGRLTTHGLGFYGFKRDDGSWSTPVASFTASAPLSREQIRARLLAELRARGLLTEA